MNKMEIYYYTKLEIHNIKTRQEFLYEQNMYILTKLDEIQKDKTVGFSPVCVSSKILKSPIDKK